jgi:hypothetical protein
MSHGARFTDAATAVAFILAGRARVTLVSRKTGTRFTYRVSGAGETNPIRFVGLLNGGNNETDFTFLGTIFDRKAYRHGTKSKVSRLAPSAMAFAWAFGKLAKGELPEELEVWHEGRCGKCGRALTVPESIASGIGPVCEGSEAA